MASPTRLAVIPRFNEAENALPRVLDILALGFDRLRVDDGSPDGTGAIADELAASR